MPNTIAELNSYYDQLTELYRSGEFKTTSNTDRSHNSTMLRVMLDNSDCVYMYCGEMSVFRTGFYDHIDKENSIEGEKLGEYLKGKLIESLRNFIYKENSKLHIVLETFYPEYLKDLIDRNVFSSGVGHKVINIRRLDLDKIQPKFMSHFSFTDNKILRMETDRENREAVCAFGIDDKMFNGLTDTSVIIDNASVPVDNV